jgi:hypothetical protein
MNRFYLSILSPALCINPSSILETSPLPRVIESGQFPCPPDWESCTQAPVVPVISNDDTSRVSSALADFANNQYDKPSNPDWITPVTFDMSAFPTWNYDDIMADIARQQYLAKLNGEVGKTPVLPQIGGPPVVIDEFSTDPRARALLDRQNLLNDLLMSASASRAQTTPPPYITIPIEFGVLPTFAPRLPIQDYNPDTHALISAINNKGPYLTEIERIIDSA